MKGKAVMGISQTSGPAGGSSMAGASSGVQARDISCSFRRKTVLENVSFDAHQGDCIGIAGINGSGKSTLLSILSGIRKPSSGSFVCFGQDLFKDRMAFHSTVDYLPQDNPLLDDLSVLDNLKLWYGRRIPDDLPVLDELMLRDMLHLKVRSLSGGMKRRLSIACAIAEDQPVLIMDEPTSSLDLHQKEIIGKYIRSYTQNGGIAVLSTHDEQEIRMCSVLYYLSGRSLLRIKADDAVRLLKEGRDSL